MSAVLSPALQARLKLAVRSAVESCGGVDGAAATVGRGRSTCGRWMNINDADLPPLDGALALDLAVVAQGREPPVLTAVARALGRVLVVLPDVDAAHGGDLLTLLAGLSREFGEVSGAVIDGVADGRVTRAEARKVRGELADVIAKAVAMDAVLGVIEEGA